MARSLEIICTHCGKEAFVRGESVLDGFKKVGEAFVCLECGHRYASEAETPFAKRQPKVDIFATEKADKAPSIFDEGELHRSCRWCVYFIMSAFNQKCGKTLQWTDATDLCFDFKSKEEQPQTGG